jgi:hypothetical protein
LELFEHPRGDGTAARADPLTVPSEVGDVVTGVFGVDERPQARADLRQGSSAAAAQSYTPTSRRTGGFGRQRLYRRSTRRQVTRRLSSVRAARTRLRGTTLSIENGQIVGETVWNDWHERGSAVWAGLLVLLNASLGEARWLPSAPDLRCVGSERIPRHHAGQQMVGYRAGPGWDYCAGNGSPDGVALLAVLRG